MDIMNVLRTGMNMSISHIHEWVCYNKLISQTVTSEFILSDTQYLRPCAQTELNLLNNYFSGSVIFSTSTICGIYQGFRKLSN